MNPYQNNPQPGRPTFGANGTRVVSPNQAPAASPRTKNQASKSDNAAAWATRGVAAVGGVMIGTVASLAANASKTDEEILDGVMAGEECVDPAAEDNSGALTDGELAFSSRNYDDMSFGDAFAAVRQEYGPGAVFEWRGGIYGSYTAEEWNAMSPEQHADYAHHVNWGAVQPNQQPQHSNHAQDQHYAQTNTAPQHTEDQPVSPMHQVVAENPPHLQSAPDEVLEPQIEVVDAYVGETGSTFVVVEVENQQMVLIDQNGDQIMDYAVVDYNNNGQVEDDEITDISAAGITLGDLGVIVESPSPEPAPAQSEYTVVTDPETGAQLVSTNIDGVETVLIDQDGDDVFDFMGMDLNGNGQVDPGEVLDISSENLSMSDLGLSGNDDIC